MKTKITIYNVYYDISTDNPLGRTNKGKTFYFLAQAKRFCNGLAEDKSALNWQIEVYKEVFDEVSQDWTPTARKVISQIQDGSWYEYDWAGL